jgi:SulP family sulfate permease
MVGLLQLAMGALKLGFMVNFLSHAVISGFTSASAIVIGFSQLKHLLGIPLQSENVFMLLWEAAKRIAEVNPITLSIGVGSIVLLLFLGKYLPRVPGQRW